MKRWLGIMLLCRLGHHAPPQSEQAGKVTFYECPRCRMQWVERGTLRVPFRRPEVWRVLKGQYDPPKEGQE